MTPLAWLLARRPFAAWALSASLLGGLVSAAACSFIVGDSVPHFTCSTDPNVGDVCPRGERCSAVDGQPGVCVSVNDATPDATVVQDGGAADSNGDDTADDNTVELTADAAGDVQVARVDGAPDVVSVDAGSDAGPCSAGEIGCPCDAGVSGACETNTFCLDRQIVAAADPADAGASTGVCSKACCTSADCDKGTICYATGAGGNYCLPASTLSDRSTAGPLNGAGGQLCEAGASCRSGLCALGYCADTCCSTAAPVPPRMPMANPAAQCATGASCQFGTFPVEANSMGYVPVPHCAPAVGGGNNGAPCGSNSGCKSNLCVNDTPQTLTCRDPCRRPEDCSGGGNMREQACEYIPLPVADSDGGVVAACVPLTAAGPTPPDGGVSDWGVCKTTSDCARGYCAQTSAGQLVCVSVCFSDGDCVVSGTCRPQTLLVGTSMYSVLACK